ncbi:DegT/DnrJ/EryC1/StrS family aminotransferase, partial [Patescibacteria group bacterium]|nr:DegT/DnrJ/EryC1/StrS family aminotransferase [Patescibacteria group bacterium]
MEKRLRQALLEECRVKFPPKKFIPGQSPVPASGKVFDEQEILLATEAILDGWWTEGRFSDLFEEKISKWLGAKYAILVNSGSSANLLALSALKSARLEKKKRLSDGNEV